MGALWIIIGLFPDHLTCFLGEFLRWCLCFIRFRQVFTGYFQVLSLSLSLMRLKGLLPDHPIQLSSLFGKIWLLLPLSDMTSFVTLLYTSYHCHHSYHCPHLHHHYTMSLWIDLLSHSMNCTGGWNSLWPVIVGPSIPCLTLAQVSCYCYCYCYCRTKLSKFNPCQGIIETPSRYFQTIQSHRETWRWPGKNLPLLKFWILSREGFVI